MATPDSESFIRSFARGLTVIESLGKGSGSHTVASVAIDTGLPRTVVRRILLTLLELGYVSSDGKEFRLTPRVLNLGMTYLTSLPFWGLAQRVMEDLCATVKESVALSVFDGQQVVYVLRIPSPKVMSLRLGLGTRLPAYATSPGQVILASLGPEALEKYLAETNFKAYTARTVQSKSALIERLRFVAESGFAWADGELDINVSGLSVPVRDTNRQVVAALSANFLSGERTRAKAVKQLLPSLRQAADELRAVAPTFLSPRVGGRARTS